MGGRRRERPGLPPAHYRLLPPCPARRQLKMYLSPICIRQRDSRLGSSMNVVAGPVKLNTGTGAAGSLVSNLTSLSGDVAAALATLRTPHDELSMFRKFRMSTLSWNVWRVSPPPLKACRNRRSTVLYHRVDSRSEERRVGEEGRSRWAPD